MVEKVTQIKSGISINVGVSVKIQNNIVCTRNVLFRILLHAVLKRLNMW